MIARITPGQVFGRWTVASRAPTLRESDGEVIVRWTCRCACGEERSVRAKHLRSGRSASCGCLQRDVAREQSTVHGGHGSPIYDVWVQMIQRCENPKNKRFARYGGRGIQVCEAWRTFAGFQADMLPNYRQGLTLDRKNNDGNYEPGNCRWVTNVVNCRNNSRTLRVTWEGREVALNDLADRYGIKAHTLYARVRMKGMRLAEALGVAA